MSLALMAAVKGDAASAKAAAAAALAQPYALAGPGQAAYVDVTALVFDWCYGQLEASDREALAKRIDADAQLREAALDKRLGFHESHYLGFQAYLSDALALEGEPGFPSRLRTAEDFLQKWMAYAGEIYNDGTYKCYSYQDVSFLVPPFLFASATTTDFTADFGYASRRSDVLLRLLSEHGTNFIGGPGDQYVDEHGFLGWNPSAIAPLMIAEQKHDPLAQFAGELLRDRQGWFATTSPMPTWMALLYYDDKLASTGPVEMKTPPVEYFQTGGSVDFRSGWQQIEGSGPDINAWFYAGPRAEHADCDAGHFILWRGDDDLIVRGGAYLGIPSAYHDNWDGLSFSRNTLAFSPAGSASPDRDGSQLMHPPPALSATHYPISDALRKAPSPRWFRPIPDYEGEITSFKDSASASYVTADIAAAYDPAHVHKYLRTVVYVKPDVFLIRDVYEVENIDRVRMIFHYRQKPDTQGLSVAAGTDSAGILEGLASSLAVKRGTSQARIRLLTPDGATLRLVGGPGYEAYLDGKNNDGNTMAETWLLSPGQSKTLAARMKYVADHWRSEFEIKPTAGSGEMIAAISVGAQDAALPDISFSGKADGKHVAVKYSDHTTDIGFPQSEAPPLLNGAAF